ncbi:GNAT family N-acetyltransferase [Anaerovorax odorimutans]|uniref:GNAT family N-acetyltransferase n=1 Tax=Anaerovorax odorimutans TaxID=109327 RepID=A0ABT1RN26_9FIRM|nr:GNAT family N-acetyltransferase [Anaerovorax odorimutans]MCQ4636582.1 GNAT family N-acetyltransferase [Anaerovorax odorimutans]
MKIIIKQFHELNTEELYQILKLRSDIFVVEQNCVYPDCDGRDRYAHHLFVEQNNHVVGYLRILEKGQTFDQIAIGRLVVRADYRGIGLARHMMNKALLFIDEYLHEKVVRLSAQQYLVGFYESLGFRSISEGYVEDGIPHIDMEYSSVIE